MSPHKPLAGDRRNFLLGVLNGLSFTLAETLIDPTLVLVAFVSRLTDSPVLIGLVAPLRDGGWFLPQLWASGRLQSQPYKLPLYRRAAVVRAIAWGAMASSVFVLRDPAALLAVFFATFGTYVLASGLSGLPFVEVVGKTIPPGRRAVFFAWRLFTGGLAALGAAAVVRRLLDDRGPLAFPDNFGALFGFGWVWAVAGLWAFGAVDEPPDTVLRPRASVSEQFRRARAIVGRDRNYRRFLSMRSSLLLAGAAVPFFAVYVQRELGGSLSLVATYLATFTVAQLLANVLFGRFAARLGNRRIMALAALAGMLMTLSVAALVVIAQVVGVSGSAAALWLVPAFALSGVRESGLGVSSQALLLEIAPVEDRSLYVGFTNTWLGVVLLATGLSGVIVAVFGFPALLAFSLLANGVALIVARQLQDSAPPALHQPARG